MVVGVYPGIAIATNTSYHVTCCTCVYTFFYRQLDFSSEPGVANEILENEPKSYLTVA